MFLYYFFDGWAAGKKIDNLMLSHEISNGRP